MCTWVVTTALKGFRIKTTHCSVERLDRNLPKKISVRPRQGTVTEVEFEAPDLIFPKGSSVWIQEIT